jgi:glycosyltransferase involved in cell wall biosynthesis
MRLAVYHCLPSGGAKRALFESVRRLSQNNDIDVFTYSTAEHTYADLRPYTVRHIVTEFQPLPLFGSPLGRLNQWQRWRDLHRLRRLEHQIAQAINQGGYDLAWVHPNQWTQAPLVLNDLQTPSVYYVQEPLRSQYEAAIARPYLNRRRRSRLDRIDPLIPLYRQTLARWDRVATRRATLRLTNSRFTAEQIRRIYQCDAQVSTLGVDTEVFQPPTGGAARGGVLSVGALRPNKGFDFIIRSLGRLPAPVRPAFTLIANADDIAERAYLEQLANERSVALKIEVAVSDARLVHAYSTAALFAYAPVREPLGLAALEAMACGTPVVGVAEGGVAETVVHQCTGLLCRRDLDDFGAALQVLLADPARSTRYGRQARRHVEEHFSWARAVKQLQGQLESVLAGGRFVAEPATNLS